MFASSVVGALFPGLQSATLCFSGCQNNTELEPMKGSLAEVQKSKQVEQANLANFDDLDFNVYSGQRWDTSRGFFIDPLRGQE